MELDNPIYDFLSGFLLGLHETKKVEDLLKCLKNADHILEKIREALEKIAHLKSLDDLLLGLKMLFAALTELEELLKPCLDGFEQFKRLMKEIRNIDFEKLLHKLISHWPYYIDDIVECIIALAKGHNTKAGKFLGDILYRLFLVDSTVHPIPCWAKYIEGFLKGIHEPKTLMDIHKCIANALPFIIKLKIMIKELVKLIKSLKYKEIIPKLK